MTAWETALARMDEAAARITASDIQRGAAAYDRRRDLPKLLGHRCLIMDDAEIVEALENGVGAAAKMAAENAHTYDRNRHVALRQALAAERQPK